jgi:ABC-type multidrug transport system ATPase subunit
MQDLLSIKNIHNYTLNGANLTIAQNKISFLIGLNGAGKTTIIKSILSLIHCLVGEITIDGISHKESKSRQNIAYLPEKFHPSPYLKAIEFLKFHASLSNAEFDLEETLKTFDEFEFDRDCLYSKISSFSKGMVQKLGLIAVFLSKKKLLILDEPMNGLDVKARKILKNKMLKYRNENGAIFFTSHLLADIDDICDDIAILNQGKIIYQGDVESLKRKHNSSIEDAFLAEIN